FNDEEAEGACVRRNGCGHERRIRSLRTRRCDENHAMKNIAAPEPTVRRKAIYERVTSMSSVSPVSSRAIDTSCAGMPAAWQYRRMSVSLRSSRNQSPKYSMSGRYGLPVAMFVKKNVPPGLSSEYECSIR